MQSSFFQIVIPFLLIPLLLLALWRIRLKLLATYHSPILGKIEVLEKYNGEKILTTNSYIQGISVEKESVQQSYWFCVAEQAVKFCRGKKDPQVLMLGLGANTISNLIAKLDPKIRQTIVEIDDYIILACQRFFGLKTLPNCQLIQADAFKLLGEKGAFGQKHDVVIVDIFTGNPPYVSISSNQPNFIEKLLPWTKKDGTVIFNRPGHTEEARLDSKKLESYLTTIFKKTQVLDIKDPRGFRNSVIIATLLRQDYAK